MPQASWARWRGGDEAVRAYRKLAQAGDSIDLQVVDEVCTAFGWYPTDFYEEW